ncbi:MAG: hypothetical protein FJ100_05285 [Deltaproteobacteria bacterium]|nr:hypothetical protein [Deltaproteobacteria bacterium]
MRTLSPIVAVLLASSCATSGSGGSTATATIDVHVAASETTGAAETASADAPVSTDAASPEIAAAADTTRAPEDAAPPEPCAQQVGKVLCNLEGQGYIRDETTGLATEAPYLPSFVLAEAIAKTTQKYAIVMLGAWWCGKCRAATGLVVSKLGQYGKKAAFINLLVEGDTPSKPATKSNLQTWASQLKVPFTIGCDMPDTPFALKKELGPRETAYILERATMKVLYKGPNVASALKELDGLPE